MNMESNHFLQELGFDTLVKELPEEIANKIEGIDGVHYSGEHPAIIIKKVQNFEPPVLINIAKIQKEIWNNGTVVFLYVVSPFEIRIYNCNAKPVYSSDDEIETILKEKQVETCTIDDKNKLAEIKHIFSAVGIDCGTIWMSDAGYAKKIRLKTKVDEYLVNSLIALAKKLVDDIDKTENNKKKSEEIVHSLLMRSIFIMYLQDRDAIPQSIWDKVGEDDFLRILNSHEQTYNLFGIISSKFNGNAFPLVENEKSIITPKHLEYLQNCLTDGNINTNEPLLFEKWRLFNFSLIRIEMLSEIYENFLSQFNPEGKKKSGAYYTPPALVELVLNNVLPKNETDYNKKILDPACGSGIFLAMAYKRLVERWKKAHKKETDFKTLSKLLKDNIYGVELDENSIKVAAFSLYLSMLDFLNPKDVWLEEGKQFPNLILDEESENEQDKLGSNLFRADTIKTDGKFENIKYDLIIGNPPFGTNGLTPIIKDYCTKHKFDKQFVIPFIHKSAELIKNNGKIALLFNTKMLTNNKPTAQKFRKWLFNDNYVDKVFNLSILRKAPDDFGGHLFSSATVPVSIVFLQKSTPKKPSNTIEYWAPTTFIKNHVADGVVIDSTDIKYLPRTICQQPNSKIWKIAQWGTIHDFYLIDRFTSNIQSYLDQNGFEYGVGLELSAPRNTPNLEIKKILHLPVKKIFPYKTRHERFISITNEKFRRTGDVKAYKSPHVIFKEGITKNKNDIQIIATYSEIDCSYYKGLVGIHSKNIEQLKILTTYINSAFSKYFLFLTSSSWGIERDVVKYNEVFELPNILSIENKKNKSELLELVNSIIAQIDNNKVQIDFNRTKNNNLIYKLLSLSNKDILLIEDILTYKFSLFYDKENSIALRPIAQEKPETIAYSKMLCDEINAFLKSGNLKVNAKVYNVTPYAPLCIVKIKFSTDNKTEEPVLLKADNDFEKDLKIINEYTLSEYAERIYIRKQVRYYTEDEIYIAKPNQKRFWTRSQGIDDAGSIINELISKSGVDE